MTCASGNPVIFCPCQVVYAKDPGGSKLEKTQIGPFRISSSLAKRKVLASNLRRLIVSSAQGIASASTPLVLKCRTDYLPANTRILDAYPQADSIRSAGIYTDHYVFSRPVLTLEWFSRDPTLIPYLHHPGDIIMAGAKEDLFRFFNVPLPEDIRHCNEQYLWIHCIGGTLPKKFPHGCCFSPAASLNADRYMLLNFYYYPMGDHSDFSVAKSLDQHNLKQSCYQATDQIDRIHKLKTTSYQTQFVIRATLRYLTFTCRGMLGFVKRNVMTTITGHP